MLNEAAPAGAAPARFATATPGPGLPLRTFGYPGRPARANGMWVDAELKGAVGGGLLQVESLSGQSVKAQPGYSGSPAWEHGGDKAIGLRVNSVHPTGVRTLMDSGAMQDEIGAAIAGYDRLAPMFMNLMPVDIIEPEDIADTVVFIASDESKFITAHELALDAGVTEF